MSAGGTMRKMAGQAPMGLPNNPNASSMMQKAPQLQQASAVPQNPMMQGGPPPWAQSQQPPQNPYQLATQANMMGSLMGGMGGPMGPNPMQQGQMMQNPTPQQGGFPPYLGPMMGQQGMSPQGTSMQGMAGGKGGMPGAGPAPNAMQQFSKQQGLAGLMKPQQSSTNSLL